MRTRATIAIMALVLVAVSGCASGTDSARTASGTASSSVSGPARGEDGACSVDADLPDPPRRVVTMDGSAAAILTRLGLGDRIVGTGGTDFISDFSGALRSQLDALPVIDRRTPNRETVLASKPDLVTGVSTYEFGGFAGSPTAAQLEQNDIAPLVACDVTKGRSTGIDATYRYITELARVFQVEARGRELVASLRDEIDEAEAVGGRAKVLTLSAAPTSGTSINTYGGSSLANGIISLAGGTNIAGGVLQDFASLSPEEVVRADPAVIVAVTGFAKQTPEQLLKSLEGNSVIAGTSAVRNRRIVVVSQAVISSPNLLNAQAVAAIAGAIRTAN